MCASQAPGSLRNSTNGMIEARKGKAITVKKGQSLRITNTHGKQVIDFFAFALDSDLKPPPAPTLHFLSMQHTRSGNMNLTLKPESKLYSSFRKPMFILEEDTSPGVHDTLVPACDSERYRQLGVQGYHASCAENLHIALEESGYPCAKDFTPAPLNLWMNVPVGDGGTLAFVEPVSCAGDYVVMRAEQNCLVVCSACPQDVTPVNGNGQKPSDCHFEVY
ncbi:MAG: hypothetical protein Q9166_002898 [cf. Caloplaca sp. 2 TL-2023]